jgi:putative multiple sugar transport system ATP-binding protein
MNYPTIEDAIGKTPLVALQRIDAAENGKRGNVILGKLEGNNPAGSVKDRPAPSMIRRAEERAMAESYRQRLNVRTPNIDIAVGTLSGGNQQKVMLAKWLNLAPRILILDEPTRGIDVGAKYEIYSIINELADAGKAVVVISSEMPELIGICDRIMVMHEGEFVGEVAGEGATQENIMRAIMRRKGREE